MFAVSASPGDETREAFLVRQRITDVEDDKPSGARVLPVYFRAGDGKRERTWQSVCETVQSAVIDDFPLRGPRTAMWCLRYLARQQMHPDDYHLRVKQRFKLHVSDWGVSQHQLAMTAVAIACCSDQVDLPNVGTIQHLLREAQMVEYHYRGVERDLEDKSRREKKGGGNGLPAEEADLFLGAHQSPSDCMVCPDLTEWISKQLERESQIQKQVRQAREERAMARK